MSARIWTADEIRAHGVRIDGLKAVMIAYGVGRTRGYQILASGEAGFKVIRVPGSRNRYVVPVTDLIRFLGLDIAEDRAA